MSLKAISHKFKDFLFYSYMIYELLLVTLLGILHACLKGAFFASLIRWRLHCMLMSQPLWWSSKSQHWQTCQMRRNFSNDLCWAFISYKMYAALIEEDPWNICSFHVYYPYIYFSPEEPRQIRHLPAALLPRGRLGLGRHILLFHRQRLHNGDAAQFWGISTTGKRGHCIFLQL